MPERILCLSVKQPWAELLVSGRKQIEVRTWWPREQLPVLVAIHAGMKVALDAPAPIWQAVEMRPSHPSCATRLGGIVGVARFVDRHDFGCRAMYTTAERGHEEFIRLAAEHLMPLDWWRPGLVGLRFDRPVRFPEIMPMRGQLGLFRLDPEMEGRVREAMEGAR